MIHEWNEESLNRHNALLYAMGVPEENARCPVIGPINSWNEMNPGRFPFRNVVAEMKEKIYKANGPVLELPVAGTCDGIYSSTPNDRYTLPVCDLISSGMEMVAELSVLEGVVIVSTCDKVMPGMIMDALRVNIPTVMLTGGSIAAGHIEKGEMPTLTHTKQAYVAYIVGDIDRGRHKMVVRNACPTPGACSFMGIVNTTCTLAEILGLSPHGNTNMRSQTSEWHETARSTACRSVQAVHDNIRPQSFITQGSFENAVRYMMVTGGSTNSLLHISATAHRISCEVSPETFDHISHEVPVISAIYPNHPTYTMEEFSAAGGLGAVVKGLVKAGKTDTKCGGMLDTIGEEAELAYNSSMGVIHPVEGPIHKQGGLVILHGNIGSENAVVKFGAVDPEAQRFSDPAKCYDSQNDAWSAILHDEVVPGDVVVIRYEGPKGSPGVPHMGTFMTTVLGKGMDEEIALVSDERFSGTTGGLTTGHVSPETYEGGNLALIENGDVVHIDTEGRTLTIGVSDEGFDRRRASQKLAGKSAIGQLDLYRRNYISAHKRVTAYWKK